MIAGYACRAAALDALFRWENTQHHLAESLSRNARLDRRDHALALEICTTALRWKMLLDYHLRPFVREDTAEELRWVLRLTLAQTHVLDRIPMHAAVDLGVELAREVGGKGGAGFANAVLRRAMDNPLRPPTGDDPDSVAVRHSHPKWLVTRWIERHGLDVAESMMEAGNREPALWVRVRRGATDLPWSASQVLHTAHDGFFVMPDGFRDQVLSSESFRRGDLALQDPASGAAALLLAPVLRPKASLLDLCAAPGGKIACLADHGDLEGVRTYAFDRSGFRQRKTLDGFRHKGIEAMVAVADGTCPPFKPGSLDAILLDAPCSNLGVLSRRPEARWKAKPSDPEDHGELQEKLLLSAWDLLKPGGHMVYSVCSTEVEECQQVVAQVPDAVRVREELRLPGQDGWDGFYAVLLRKP